jgi:hypothetical protein
VKIGAAVRDRLAVGGFEFSECADPHRHGDEECAHADQRNDVLEQIGHISLLLLMCFHFVLFLFKVSRTQEQAPAKPRQKG